MKHGDQARARANKREGGKGKRRKAGGRKSEETRKNTEGKKGEKGGGKSECEWS
jgi:hypothetical protein